MAAERDLPDQDEVLELLRLGPSDIVDEQPPGDLWDRIAAAGSDVDADSDSSSGSAVSSLAEARTRTLRFRRAMWAVGAAAAVLLAVPLALAVLSDDESPIQETADLARLEGFTGSGRAELRGRELTVEVDELEPLDAGFYELWLLDLDGGDLTGLRSLGQIADDGTFTVPDDVDLTVYDVVDISVEPDDGDPTHSGESVLQGRLGPT